MQCQVSSSGTVICSPLCHAVVNRFVCSHRHYHNHHSRCRTYVLSGGVRWGYPVVIALSVNASRGAFINKCSCRLRPKSLLQTILSGVTTGTVMDWCITATTVRVFCVVTPETAYGRCNTRQHPFTIKNRQDWAKWMAGAIVTASHTLPMVRSKVLLSPMRGLQLRAAAITTMTVAMVRVACITTHKAGVRMRVLPSERA